MRALVAYMSKTGNTKKVAEAIYGALDCEKEIASIEQVADISEYDLAFLGFPMQRFGPDTKTIRFLHKHCQPGRDVALFITDAAPEEAPELPRWLDEFSSAAASANVVGRFDCQRQLATWIKLVMSVLPDRGIRDMARRDNSHGQPDEARLHRARSFAREVLDRQRG